MVIKFYDRENELRFLEDAYNKIAVKSVMLVLKHKAVQVKWHNESAKSALALLQRVWKPGESFEKKATLFMSETLKSFQGVLK